MATIKQSRITPFLWFDGQVEEAVKLYTKVFKNSKIINLRKFGDPKAKTMTATFMLEGQKFMALDGGPHFKFTPAVSFFIDCKTQKEVDHLWEKLSAGGEKSRCGWIKDKFGVSWQIVPEALSKYLSDPDQGKAMRVMNAMIKMDKIIIKDLDKAYKGK
jgi:predicted 3-demethylubiquinone-9 3-methyltransferase (glyoxalase superfamily)